jgi:peptide/nickel transport system substrate-binding protein
VRESEAEELGFREGNIDVISRFDPQDFSILEAGSDDAYRIYDAGPGFEYTFLVFNLNDITGSVNANLARRQGWFRQAAFRQAVSSVVDRDGMVRLAYSGRAYPLAVQISPGNRNWLDPAIPRPVRSLSRAKDLLRTAHFSWSGDGSLKDALGQRVEFSILYNANKASHERLAAVLQQDLKQVGIDANPVPMDFATLVDRVFNRLNYDTAIMTLADGDADPNTEMNVLLSTGQAHLWNLRTKRAPEEWQNQIDQLMKEQMTTLDRARRRQMFNRVQEIMWREQPLVFLISPDILAGANARVRNFKPAVLSSYTLWNADQLSLTPPSRAHSH